MFPEAAPYQPPKTKPGGSALVCFDQSAIYPGKRYGVDNISSITPSRPVGCAESFFGTRPMLRLPFTTWFPSGTDFLNRLCDECDPLTTRGETAAAKSCHPLMAAVRFKEHDLAGGEKKLFSGTRVALSAPWILQPCSPPRALDGQRAHGCGMRCEHRAEVSGQRYCVAARHLVRGGHDDDAVHARQPTRARLQ
jgi:hypothetical protein